MPGAVDEALEPTVILFAANTLGAHGQPINGPAISSCDTLLALLAAGGPVTVVSRNRCETPGRLADRPLVRPRWIIAGSSRLSQWHSRWAARRLQPAVIVANDLYAHRRLEVLRDWPPCPRVIILRSSPEMARGEFAGGPSQWDRTCRELSVYSSVVSVSAHVLEKWRAAGMLEGKNGVYIPNCAREELAAPLLGEDRAVVRCRLGLPPDAFLMVCVASVQHRKGQDVLLDAWPQLAARRPDLVLALVGPVLEDRGGAEIRERIARASAGGRILLVGPRENSLEYSYAADVCVLPSRGEAMPLTLLEAMVLRRPILASNVDGIPELVEDGVTGGLFRPGDPAALVAAFDRMAAGPDIAGMGERGADRYWNQFCRARQIERWRALLGHMMRP
jgi:glycosyltransferase involved in cell wall biosynthesis